MRGEHLGRLVNQLLDLSRLEAGADRLGAEELEIGDLLHELAGELRLTHPTALIEVKAPLGLRSVGDREQLARVLTNIIGNALPAGGGLVGGFGFGPPGWRTTLWIRSLWSVTPITAELST